MEVTVPTLLVAVVAIDGFANIAYYHFHSNLNPKSKHVHRLFQAGRLLRGLIGLCLLFFSLTTTQGWGGPA